MAWKEMDWDLVIFFEFWCYVFPKSARNLLWLASLIKFIWYLRRSFTEAFCLWLKPQSNDFSTELTYNSKILVTLLLYWRFGQKSGIELLIGKISVQYHKFAGQGGVGGGVNIKTSSPGRLRKWWLITDYCPSMRSKWRRILTKFFFTPVCVDIHEQVGLISSLSEREVHYTVMESS